MTSRIMIVGAGVAGLSLAQWLLRFGFNFEIIEQNPSERRSPHGVVLPFNAVRELKTLGLFEPLEERYASLSKISYCRTSGREISAASLTAPPFEGEQFIALAEERLLSVLRRGLEKKIRYNTRLVDISHVEDGARISCTYELLDGRYDLVIAADGVGSLVRQKNFEGQKTLHDHRAPCWRFVLDYPGHGLQPMHFIGPVSQIAVYPLSDDMLYCYAHVREDPDGVHLAKGATLEENGQLGPDAKDNLRRIFARFGGPVPEILARLGTAVIVPDRLRSVTEPCFFDRRIAFVGDAAHGCAPLIQQGTAMALADSRCLADALAMQQIDQALLSYEERRKPVTLRLMRAADAPLVTAGDSGTARFLDYFRLRLLGPDNVRIWRRIATDRKFRAS